MLMLGRVAAMVRDAGHEIAGVDVTVIAQSVRVSPHRDDMRSKLANVLAVGVDDVSVKATTTDGMGFTGREEGIAATAVALLS
jgi:2-C-methyl-D-erythritol 2,4-cyclodiphosphate synthase